MGGIFVKIERNLQTNGYWTVVEKAGKYYYFDLSPVHRVYKLGPECMGFLSDADGNVEDWSEIYVNRPSEVSPEALRKCVEEFLTHGGV